MTDRLAELRRVIESASEASVVRNALTDAAALDVKTWKADEWAEWLGFLLDVVAPGWLSCFVASERTSYFDVFFVRCPPMDGLTAVHTYLSREAVSGEGLAPLIEIVVTRVPALIRVASQQPSSLWHLTLAALFSLPERLANRTKRVPQYLHPKCALFFDSVLCVSSGCSYFAQSVVLQALTLGGERQPFPSLVGALLGQAARLGHSGTFAFEKLRNPFL